MREALSFLTPLGGAVDPSPRAFGWFPVVGALIGLLVGGVWWGAGEVWGPGVAAALAITADLAVTGMLHLDGLADSADGLLPPLPRERRLEVMRAPDVGAFGIGAAGAALLLRWSALVALDPSPLLVGAIWSASRTLMALVAGSLPYARPEGLATPFLGHRPRAVALLGLLLAGGLAGGGHGTMGAASLAGAVAGAFAVSVLAHRRLGGFTGDVLGAAGVVAETVGLVVAAAWGT